MYSVLIVDDDKLARKGLIAITDWAKCGMQVVGDVANGKLAMDLLGGASGGSGRGGYGDACDEWA